MALSNFSNPNINHHSFLKFILFTLICSSIGISHGVEEASKPHYHVVSVSSLTPKPHCTGRTKGSQTLVVTSKNGPCSRNSRTKQISAYDEAFMNDEARVRSLNFRKVPNLYSKDSAESGSLVDVTHPYPGGQYLTTIGLGTPKVDYEVIIDTGSDYTWVRCEPCSNGCTSQDPLFDPSKSSTYLNESCQSYTENGKFDANYYDQTYSTGHWGCDKLSLESSDVIDRFQFGCGLNNNGGPDNFANGAGVLGLGKGDLSILSQTASKFHNTFSYCLPKTSSSEGYLEFGDRARSTTASSGLKFTSLINEPSGSIPSSYNPGSLYFVELLGISVAGIRLNVPSTAFTSQGTVIDSGTVLTVLPKSVYNALRAAFNQSMAEYPTAAPVEKLDTCYNLEGIHTVRLPAIVFHFGGGTDVSLNPSGIVWISEKNPNIWCLGFAANKMSGDLFTVLGNNQQRDLDVLYDIDTGRIGFGAKPCGG